MKPTRGARCTSDYGIWSIRNAGEVVSENLSSDVCSCSGHMYVNDGVLLVAGVGGAALLENDQWQLIFSAHEMEQALERQSP